MEAGQIEKVEVFGPANEDEKNTQTKYIKPLTSKLDLALSVTPPTARLCSSSPLTTDFICGFFLSIFTICVVVCNGLFDGPFVAAAIFRFVHRRRMALFNWRQVLAAYW
jgi:hypothetical protein